MCPGHPSLDVPCTPLSGGFSSPIDSKKGDKFSIGFEGGAEEIWYACAAHCHKGELGAIFPVKDEPTINFDPEGNWSKFLRNAESAQNSFASVPKEGAPLGSGVGARVIANSGTLSVGHTHLTKATIGGIAAGVAAFLIV